MSCSCNVGVRTISHRFVDPPNVPAHIVGEDGLPYRRTQFCNRHRAADNELENMAESPIDLKENGETMRCIEVFRQYQRRQA